MLIHWITNTKFFYCGYPDSSIFAFDQVFAQDKVIDVITIGNNSFGVADDVGNGNMYATTLILFDQKSRIYSILAFD